MRGDDSCQEPVNGGERVRQGIDGFMEEQTLSVQGKREVATMSEYTAGVVRDHWAIVLPVGREVGFPRRYRTTCQRGCAKVASSTYSDKRSALVGLTTPY